MEPGNTNDGNSFSKEVGEKEKRKLQAQKEKGSAWFGLGMFGMVGWSVVVPTLLGAALGIKLDKMYHQSFSWTLTFLITGLFIGCLIAWHWISKEHKEINKEEKDA
jgi:ATP synthase protein I